MRAAGLTGKVAIVGYDASPEARKAIAAGGMYGDAIQYPSKIGSTTIDIIHGYFGGKQPPPVIKIPVGTFTRTNTQTSP